MKKYLLVCLFFLSIVSFAFAQTNGIKANTKPNGPATSWDKMEHSFGDIPKDVPVTVTFTVKNNGNAPLIISDVRPSCGCTTPSYTKDPIMPGKTGVVKAQYNAASGGPFNKTINVITNGVKPNEVLTIKGTVIENNGQ
ncbi:MAG: DUF1573 domain-containing protein [Microscillaceae bacterium]|nr:DUF1573 domain-containing protein [Microscillaceae bacterium]